MKLCSKYLTVGFQIFVGLLLLSPITTFSLVRSRIEKSQWPSEDNLNQLLRLLPRPRDKIQARSSLIPFLTDPALLVTILHSLEIAYWTLPFGFILSPIMNLFRIPNRRMDTGDAPHFVPKRIPLRQLYFAVNKVFKNIEKLQRMTAY